MCGCFRSIITRCKSSSLTLCGILLVSSCLADAQESAPLSEIRWQKGPSIADLGANAQISVPTGFVFAGPEDTRKIMVMSHNPPSGKELGFVAPEDSAWFVVFEFDSLGYVRDDEKGSLDSDALLSAIRKANDAGNKEREKRGWAKMNIVGWEQSPHYNTTTNNLEWAIRGECEGTLVVNNNTRLLGRGGVMHVTLVSDPESLQLLLPRYRTLIGGFAFKQGSRYAEFRAGDKVAEYGLSALVVGGATAVAAKTGLIKALGKGVYALVLAAFAALVSVFRAITSRVKQLFSTAQKSKNTDDSQER